MNIDKFALTRQLLATYFFRVGWLIADCWRYFKLRIFGVVLLNWIGVTSAASVFGGFILYVRYLESGRSLTLLGIDIQLETPSMLVLSAIALLCLGIVSSVCLYKTDWLIAHLAIAYQKRAIYRLFQVASDPAYQGWQKLVDGPHNQAMQVFLSTTRGTAIALRRLLSGILPALIFVFSLVLLILTSATLTALLLPFVAIYLIPLYQANHWVMQKQTDYSKLNRQIRKSISQALDYATETHMPADQKMVRAQQVLETSDYQAVGILFYARKMIGSRLQLVNTIFFVTCVIGVFAFFAIATNHGSHRWSDLLLYLFALRFAFGGLQQVTSVFGKMSRLAPIYRYYVDFMSQAERYRRQRQRSPLLNQPLPQQLVCSFSSIELAASAYQTDIQVGTPIWILTPEDPTYGTLEAIAAHLEDTLIPPADLITKSAFITEASLLATTADQDTHTLRQLLGSSLLPLHDYLDHSGLRAELDQYYNGMQQGQNPDSYKQQLSPEALYLLGIWPLLQSKTVAWISVPPLIGLNPEFVEALFKACPDHYLFLVNADPAKALKRSSLKHQRHRSVGVLVFGNRGVAGCGTIHWLKTYLDDIQAYLVQQKDAAGRLYRDLDNEDDIEDD